MSNSIVTPWTVACQATLSMHFSSQEYWIGLPFPTPVDFPDTRIELASFSFPALAGRFFATSPPGKLSDLTVSWIVLSRITVYSVM